MTINLLAQVKNQLFYLWFSTSTTIQASYKLMARYFNLWLDMKFLKNHLKYHVFVRFFNKHITSTLAPKHVIYSQTHYKWYRSLMKIFSIIIFTFFWLSFKEKFLATRISTCLIKCMYSHSYNSPSHPVAFHKIHNKSNITNKMSFL